MKTRFWWVVVALVAVGGYLAWRQVHGRQAAVAGVPPGASPRSKAVTVAAATAVERDVPIWLVGLGTVQAHNAVTIRPRVSGALDQVNFTEGQMVAAGDVLARIDPRPYESALAQARARKAQNDALLANARRELTRIRSLVESEAEGRQLLDQQETAVAQLAAQVQGDEAAIAAAQLDLDFTWVRAPFAGRTGVRMIDAGNLVTANQGAGIVVVAQLQPISVVFSLPQHHLPAVQRRVTSDASPSIVQALGEHGAVIGEGRLELVDNAVDTATGTVRLKATFENKDLALWPGQFLSARLLVERRTKAVTVPAEVVQAGLNGTFAYVIRADQSVEVRPVRTGPLVEGQTVIEEGLRAGEQVVRDGQSKLQPGAKVVVEGKSS